MNHPFMVFYYSLHCGGAYRWKNETGFKNFSGVLTERP